MDHSKAFLIAILLGVNNPSAYAINIDIDYTYDSNGFFSTQSRKDVLEAAANYFEARINDNLLAINSYNQNHFNAVFSRPDTGASTTINDIAVANDTLTVFAGGMDLGSTTLGVGGPGGFNASGTQSFFDDVISRGQGDGTQSSVRGASAYDFAAWGGAISFNTTKTWYFDNDVTTDETFPGFDFFSVALHELSHLLGFGLADSWNNQIAAGFFIGTNSVANFGGDVPLDSGSGHWLNGTMSDGVETAMDPNIAASQRKRFTSLDVAGLSDVGWQMSVTAVPVPDAVWLFGSALLGLIGMSRSKNFPLNSKLDRQLSTPEA